MAALLCLLAGCRSNIVVLDERPAWVVDAEQRLKQDPVFNVDESQDEDSRPLWGRQPTEDASQAQASSTSDKRRSPQTPSTATAQQPEARQTTAQQAKTSSTSASQHKTSQPESSQPTGAQPDGVSWGETKITVEVED
ncbi:MAG: hypothetical protein R6U56_05795 [Opitutales bacterium]